MATNISRSPVDTFALGEDWGRLAAAGLLIALCGDLGAGKTQLVKGLAKGMGVTARVLSPTFALVNVYQEGRLPLFHLDLYRLESAEQILAAGLEEYFYPKGVAVIEWAERWFGAKPVPIQRAETFPPGRRLIRWVEIQIMGETERRISYEDIGA